MDQNQEAEQVPGQALENQKVRCFSCVVYGIMEGLQAGEDQAS